MNLAWRKEGSRRRWPTTEGSTSPGDAERAFDGDPFPDPVDSDKNDGNTATAVNAEQALAGVDGDNNDDNTAFASGPGSEAAAGSDGDDQDGFTAIATAWVPVTVP